MAEKTKTTIGERIKALRLKNHMTLDAFSKAIDTTRNTVYRWETGKVWPHPGMLKRMIKIFDVDMSYFIQPDSSEADQDAEIYLNPPKVNRPETGAGGDRMEHVLLTRFYELPEAKQYQVIGYAKTLARGAEFEFSGAAK